MNEDRFKKIGTFSYSSEAAIFKGKLESAGINVFMHDNFTIDSDPMLSNAVGGVKLFVDKDDYEVAKQILSEISKHSITETGEPVICPKCGSENVDLFSTIKDLTSFLSFIFSALLVVLPFYTKYKYKCDTCKFEF